MMSLAKRYPHVKVIGISRSGTSWYPAHVEQTELMHSTNISYHKANCLEPETFKNLLRGVDGCIHTVGTLFAMSKYKSLNTESAVNMAKEFNSLALADSTKRHFVLVSSAKAPPFL